jgi:hypothetical protein
MSSRQRPVEREYDISHFDNDHGDQPSVLADASAMLQQSSLGGHGGPAGTSAPDLESNASMLEWLQQQQTGDDGLRECVEADPELMKAFAGPLKLAWNDWAVTDDDARASLAVLEGAPLEQQSAMIESLRANGQLDTFLDNLPEKDRENMSGSLSALLTSDQVVDELEGWVFDRDAAAAIDLVTELPAAQQAAALAELDDNAFDRLLDETPSDRITDLEEAFALITDPHRKLRLWEAIHMGRAHNLHDASGEAQPWFFDSTDEALLARHRNGQLDANLSSTCLEVADEAQVLRDRMAAGEPITAADIEALDHRKKLEMQIEGDHGVHLTNNRGGEATEHTPGSSRRVWSESELMLLEEAFQRMPEGHVGSNPAFTEVQRRDVKREKKDGVWEENSSLGASAGSGLITFYDTGAGSRPGDSGTPWRTDPESEIAGHDATQSGGDGSTHLIQEVLSHEQGHTVHQGDDGLESDFHGLSEWRRHDGDSVRQELVAGGLSEADADLAIADLEATRDDGFTGRNQEANNGNLYQVNPYDNDGFVSINDNAIDPNDPQWAYAESNPSDHFAEIYTKAVHAPESLYEDLVAGPARQRDVAKLAFEEEQIRYDQAVEAGTLPPHFLDYLKAHLDASQDAYLDAYQAARIRGSQHQLFRDEVFGVDDSDVQALQAPPGKVAIYQEYKQQAAMCMTPQQLEALRLRYADQL